MSLGHDHVCDKLLALHERESPSCGWGWSGSWMNAERRTGGRACLRLVCGPGRRKVTSEERECLEAVFSDRGPVRRVESGSAVRESWRRRRRLQARAVSTFAMSTDIYPYFII